MTTEAKPLVIPMLPPSFHAAIAHCEDLNLIKQAIDETYAWAREIIKQREEKAFEVGKWAAESVFRTFEDYVDSEDYEK